ncbi:hypothetical protein DL93DRAFT_1894084 [Clavulina sp. PMI_390]|nr:hypothetical protein DL93DRAFT_1894084 [Clavulina sp. PMI_390]
MSRAHPDHNVRGQPVSHTFPRYFGLVSVLHIPHPPHILIDDYAVGRGHISGFVADSGMVSSFGWHWLLSMVITLHMCIPPLSIRIVSRRADGVMIHLPPSHPKGRRLAST